MPIQHLLGASFNSQGFGKERWQIKCHSLIPADYTYASTIITSKVQEM
jgi:hypothetical protein